MKQISTGTLVSQESPAESGVSFDIRAQEFVNSFPEQGPLLDHLTERCPSLPQQLSPGTGQNASWHSLSKLWASPLPFEHPCRSPVEPSAPILTPVCMARVQGCSGHGQLPLGFSSKENTDYIQLVPLITGRQKQLCFFLLPEGCGETWISNAPK